MSVAVASGSPPAPHASDEPAAEAEREDSTERLLRELEQRAAAEAAAVVAAAHEEVRGIRADAEAKCAAAREEALRDCEAAAADEHSAALAAARLDARRAVLEAQHAAVDRVLRAVRLAAREAGGQRGSPAAVVKARVADALSYLGGAAAAVRCAPPIRGAVRASIRDPAIEVSDDPSIVAGIRAETVDGRVLVDDTMDAWLARELPVLTIEICRVLGAAP